MALGLYTALPGFAQWDDGCTGLLAAMLPLVGLTLGAAWWGISALAGLFLPPMLLAAAIALFLPATTGFFHLDGFMDVTDALLSSRPRAEKVRILKDPHAGSFAVVGVCCLLLVQFAAAHGIVTPGKPLATLLLLPVVSRALAGWAMMSLAPMPESSYGRMNYDSATPARRAFCLVVAIAACVVAYFVNSLSCLALLGCGAAFCLACQSGQRNLGGMNGDIAGFSICIGEAIGLCLLACL